MGVGAFCTGGGGCVMVGGGWPNDGTNSVAFTFSPLIFDGRSDMLKAKAEGGCREGGRAIGGWLGSEEATSDSFGAFLLVFFSPWSTAEREKERKRGEEARLADELEAAGIGPGDQKRGGDQQKRRV